MSVGLKEIEEKPEPDRYVSTIAIAAAIIAAVRLAKVGGPGVELREGKDRGYAERIPGPDDSRRSPAALLM